MKLDDRRLFSRRTVVRPARARAGEERRSVRVDAQGLDGAVERTERGGFTPTARAALSAASAGSRTATTRPVPCGSTSVPPAGGTSRSLPRRTAPSSPTRMASPEPPRTWTRDGSGSGATASRRVADRDGRSS
jgi:hypothetical protein